MGTDRQQQGLPYWLSENVPEGAQDALFKFNFKLPNGNVIALDLRANVGIDYEALEEELELTPQNYVWWASIYSEARAMVAVTERAIKIRRKQVTDAIVESMKKEKVKLTEKIILALVEDDATLNKLEERLIKTQKETGKLYYMVKALEMKSEHLRSLSGFKRQEREQQ